MFNALHVPAAIAGPLTALVASLDGRLLSAIVWALAALAIGALARGALARKEGRPGARIELVRGPSGAKRRAA